MKKSLHMNFLLDIVLALFILIETEVNCGVIIVQSSSSTGFQTYCNGLRCPPSSNCMAFTTVINGNSTSDKRCTNIYGRVIRQETVTVANGQMCIRNLTMVGGKVNVEQSCRNLNKAGVYDMEHEEKDRKVQEALERQHDALEAAVESEERYQEWRREKLQREHEEKIEALYKAKDQRGILGDLRKNLREFAADAVEEMLEQEAEERAELLEKQQEAKFAEQEKALDEALDRMERASNALKLGTKA